MADPIETYNLGEIKVSISPMENTNKYQVHCTDGEYEITFKASEEEYKGYRKLMNRRIKREFSSLGDDDSRTN